MEPCQSCEVFQIKELSMVGNMEWVRNYFMNIRCRIGLVKPPFWQSNQY